MHKAMENRLLLSDNYVLYLMHYGARIISSSSLKGWEKKLKYLRFFGKYDETENACCFFLQNNYTILPHTWQNSLQMHHLASNQALENVKPTFIHRY